MYIELFLLDNFLMDMLTLRLACAFCARPCRLPRTLLFSLLGTVYAFCAAQWVWPGSWPCGLLFGAVMALALPNGKRWQAYGRAVCGVWLSAFLLGGMLLAARCAAAEWSLRALLMGACAAAFVPNLLRRAGRTAASRLRFVCGGRAYEMEACLDTGNALREPLSGRPVIVAGPSELSASAAIPIPARTAAGETVLYALRPERLTLDGVPVDALIAFAQSPMDTALVPPMALL